MMNKTKCVAVFAVMAALLLALSASAYAGSIDIKLVQSKELNVCKALDNATGTEIGAIDWDKNKIRASGIGFANRNLPANADEAQIRGQAKTAAEVIAQRNLLGIIKGMVIQSKTVVSLSELESDDIIRVIDGTLEGAETIDESPQGSRGYKVTMQIDMKKLLDLPQFRAAKDRFTR